MKVETEQGRLRKRGDHLILLFRLGGEPGEDLHSVVVEAATHQALQCHETRLRCVEPSLEAAKVHIFN